MEHPGEGGSGEVEAEAEAILNKLAPIGLLYILNGVGRVTKWQLPGVVVVRVKSLWEC